MRRVAVRIAPAAAAAFALPASYDCKRDRKVAAIPFMRLQAGAVIDCDGKEVKEKFTRMLSKIPKSPSFRDKTTRGLLGQSHWIYRLVNSEDIHNVYELEEEIGQGGFGTVYLGRHKEMGYYRAVKKIPLVDGVNDREEMMTEIDTLLDLDHPHIIKLSRTYDDGQNLYIVSELCSGPSLLDRIIDGPMSEQEMGDAMRHMLKAVQCCHSHYMGHYDIKPDNFMFSDTECKRLKMIDLGLSSGFKRDTSEFKGTVAYMAPEVFCGMYGPEADVWSCGVVLFLMAVRDSFCPPDASEEEMAVLLQDRNWIKERLSGVSDEMPAECMDLIIRMLCQDRHMRITAADALKHPFVDSTYKPPKSRQDKRGDKAALNVMSSMPDSFTSFGSQPVLVRAALSVMVHIAGYVTKETTAQRLAFSMLDRVGSGELSIDSIEGAMPHYGLKVPPNMNTAFQAVDINKNGYITYTNFLAATLPQSVRCKEELWRRAFNLLDRNHDGFIDIHDLIATFLRKDEKHDKALRKLCREAISEVSSSTRIDFDEFLHMMKDRESVIDCE